MNQTKIHNHDARALANYRKGNLLILLATAVVIFVSAKSLRAATYYWDVNQGTSGLGGTGNWGSSSQNWNTSSTGGTGTYTAIPGATDTLIFAGTAGVITVTNGSTITTNVGALTFNTSGYVLTAGSSTFTISNATTTLGNGVSLTLSNGGTILGFRGGVMTGGAGSKLLLAGSANTTVGLENFDISNTLSIDMSGTTTSNKIIGFAERGGSSTIRADVLNNSANFFMLGANSGNTLNMNGVISGTGGISLSSGSSGGSGTVNLYGANTYQGNTLINSGSNGVIRIRTNDALSTVSFVQYGSAANSGGILDLYGNNQTIAGITSGATALGAITNSQAGLSTFTVNQTTNTSFGVAIGGNLALVKTNSGSLTLTSANTYSGGTTVSGGTLVASNAAALGTGSVTVGSGGTLSVRANVTNSVANSGTVSIGTGGTLTATSLGTGALSLAGATGAGNTASFVSQQTTNTLSIGALTFGGYTSYSMASGKNVSSSGAITLSGTNNAVTLTGSVLGAGTYNLFSGSSVSTSGLNTGGFTLTGTGVGNSVVALNGSQQIVGRTTYDFTSTSTALQLVVGGGAFNMTWNGGNAAWDYTASSWQKDGTGSNIAFYSGDNATISSGNTLTVDAAGVAAGTVSVNNTVGTATLAGGNLTASSLSKSGAGTLVVSNAITVISGVTQSAGTLTTAGNLTVSNTGVSISGGTANLNGNNTIVSGGLTVSGGTAVLNGSNTISAGGLNISSGSLTVNSTNTISGGVNANGGVLVVNANGALGTNAISMNGGTLGVGTLGTVTNAITLGASGGTVTNASAFSLSGAISGAANTLSKRGSADLNLSGAVGASAAGVGLNVQEGTVTLSGSSTKYLGNSTLNGNLIASNTTLFTQGAVLGGTGQVQIAGNTLWRGNNSSSWITNAVALQAGSVLSFSNSVNMNFLGGLTGTGDVVLSQGSGGGVYITGNVFNGTISNNTANDLRFYNANVSGITSFGGTGTGVLMFSNSTADQTVGGKISGAVALQVRGTGTTTFTNTASDFTNTININGSVSGTTAKFVGNSMGASTATAEISLGNTNTLYLDGVTSQRNIGIKSGGGTVYVAGDSSLGNMTNNTAGGQSFIKDGSGKLTFTGLVRDDVSSNAPVLNIKAGRVSLAASSATAQYISVAGTTTNYAGDLEISAGNQLGIHGTGTMGGGGKLIFSGNDAALQTSSSSANDGAVLTVANDVILNGSAGTKANIAATTSNTLVLNKVNGTGDLYFGIQSAGGGGGQIQAKDALSFTGNVYMNLASNGVVRLDKANVLANGQRLIMNRTTGSGIVDFNGNSQSLVSLESLNNDATYTGIVTNSGSAATLTLNQGADRTYGGTIDGALALVKNGAGILTLANTNTMSGGVTINGGGIYLTNGSKGLGSGTLTLNGGRLGALASGYVVTNAVVIAADSAFGKADGNGNSMTLSGGLDLNGGTRVINLDNSVVVSGGLSNGGLVIDSTLNRNFTVSGNATYAGGTTVRGGNFKLSGSGALNSAGAFNLAATTTNATLDISGLTGSGTTLGSLAGAANSSVALGAKNLAVGGNNNSTTYEGAISGTGGSLTKNGSGNFILSGNNTYTGATTVAEGKLVVNGSIANSATTVQSGATLGGSGTVGALEIASGGTLAPGNSPGTMTASSAIWNGGGTYDWEINNFLGSAGTNYDFLNVTGALTISASSGNKFIIDVISLMAADNTSGNASNFDAYGNYSFAIATAAGGILGFDAAYFDIMTAGFTNSMLPAGASGPGSWSISKNGNSINLNYAAAIPEPSTGSLLLVGLLGALAARRRRS